MEKTVFYKAKIDRDYIISLIKEALNADRRVVFAYLYGSFVNEGDFFYDIDLAIYTKGVEDAFYLTADIKGKFVVLLNKSGITDFIIDNFDVRVINDAPYDFMVDVLERGILITDKDEELRASYIEHISMEYRINQIVLNEALR